jgi:muramoyltetrapeptide carboxypeptidase
MVATGLSAALAARPCNALAATARAHRQPLVKPPRLRRGDWVAIVSPSGHVSDERLERSVRNLESLGLRVKLGRHVRSRSGNYGGTLKERLADLHGAFLDREVRVIWPSRGGSGAATLLPHLDYRLIRANAKILIGFSDITALLIALYRHAGLVTFHGIVSGSQFADYSLRHVEAVLFEGRAEVPIELPAEQLARMPGNDEDRARTLRSGVAEGPLIGGNLAVLTSLIGTPHAAPLARHLLFLEEIGEAPYRLDRMLVQLQHSGGFEQIAGLALGVFRRAIDPDGEPETKHTLTQVLEERFGAIDVPAVYGLPFGHIAPQCVLPLGVRARLDAGAQTLMLLEAAVR